jgi:DNA modification methylase
MNKIEFGDCREIMKRWIDEGIKIQTCITSPPYYGLRDYGTATWEGGDVNCDHKNAKMKSRYDYPMQEGSRHAKIAETTKGTDGAKWYDECPDCGAIKKDNQIGLEQTPKEYIENMVDVFNHVKELLADDGTLWVNIGDSYSSHKDCKSIGQTLAKGTSRENAHAMDLGKSRVRDTKMLKSQGLKNKDLIGIPWMLAFALREAGWYLRQDIIWHKPNPMPESVTDRCTKSHEYIFLLSKSDKYYFDHLAIKEPAVSGKDLGLLRSVSHTDGSKVTWHSPSIQKRKESGIDSKNAGDGMRNKRDVWSVNVKPYKGAHFATYPTALIEPCILAGSRINDIVFDPFMGSGTTAQVAKQLGRQYLGCELNKEYEKLQQERIGNG